MFISSGFAAIAFKIAAQSDFGILKLLLFTRSFAGFLELLSESGWFKCAAAVGEKRKFTIETVIAMIGSTFI